MEFDNYKDAHLYPVESQTLTYKLGSVPPRRCWFCGSGTFIFVQIHIVRQTRFLPSSQIVLMLHRMSLSGPACHGSTFLLSSKAVATQLDSNCFSFPALVALPEIFYFTASPRTALGSLIMCIGLHALQNFEVRTFLEELAPRDVLLRCAFFPHAV